jgi:hypothetical protein
VPYFVEGGIAIGNEIALAKQTIARYLETILLQSDEIVRENVYCA